MDMDMTKCIHEYLLQSVDQDTAVDYKKKNLQRRWNCSYKSEE